MVKVLHLVGSPVSSFYANLSKLYAQDCLTAIDRDDFVIAYISPDGSWRFPVSLTDEDIDKAEPLTLTKGIERLNHLKPLLALPQMFCLPGMTHYRGLLDLLQIPYIGNPPNLMALVADKAKTKAIVSAAGVKVPKGEVLTKGEQPTISLPAVVKPINGDNSIGVSIVRDPSEYAPSLELAFAHTDRVLVEEFIPLGREVRCGIIVRNDSLVCLPLEEYAMNDHDRPIRSYANKLIETDDGALSFAAKDPSQSWIVSPTDRDTATVWDSARKCHLALGCRHYSLFDFRIDPQGQAYFLEAGLYCSFSPKSVISSMTQAIGLSLPYLFNEMINLL